MIVLTSALPFDSSLMAPIYEDSFRGDADLIECFNSLRIGNNPSPHPGPPTDKIPGCADSSDEVEQPASKSNRTNRVRLHYPDDPLHWVEYGEDDWHQARPRPRSRQSTPSTDEYPDSEVDRQIAAVDLDTLNDPEGIDIRNNIIHY